MYRGLFLFFLITFFQPVCSQNSDFDFEIFRGEEIVSTDYCLSNRMDLSLFQLRLIKGELNSLSKLSISANFSQSITQNFTSLEAFNAFNFKFWLLSNSAFKDEKYLNIKINAIDNTGNVIEEQFLVCLVYVKSELVKDRGPSDNPEFVKLPIYFATDRNYVESEDVYEKFGVERSDLKYGICEVSIPHDHKIGKIESPSMWRFEFSEDPEKHVVMHSIKVMEHRDFFKSLASAISKTKRKRTFLFVHGYNVSFGDAAKRTAQISYDLLFEGKAVFYSWPSQSSLLGYSKDEANIAWAQTNIKNFLEDYITKSGAEEIYLVAHSMGNRGLTRAIISLIAEKPELRSKIKEIILAAPDIDADVFKRDIAPKMVSLIDKPITLYVSSDDMALKASKQLHGSSRVGDAGEDIIVLKGIETIDASGVDTSFMSHSYFADTSSIISDIYDMIKSGKRALQRDRLDIKKINDLIYWKVKN